MRDAARKKDATRQDTALEVTFPGDLAGSRALIEQLTGTVDSRPNIINSQTHTIDRMRREKQELELAFADALQRMFRKRSERYINNPNQLRLDWGDTEAVGDAAEIQT